MKGSDRSRPPADSLSDTLETVRLTPERAASLVQAALDSRGAGAALAAGALGPAIRFGPDAGFDEDAPTRPGIHPRGSAAPVEPPSYEFESGAAWLELPGPLERLTDLRVALVDADAPRADAVAQDLRLRGAQVQVFACRADVSALERLRAFDPSLLLVDPADALQGATQLLAAVALDPWLHAARVLPVAWAEHWDPSGEVKSDALTERIALELRPLRAALSAAGKREQFGCDLSRTPVSTLIRCLADAPPCSLRISCPERVFVVAFLDGVVTGALATRAQNTARSAPGQHASSEERVAEGPLALAQLLRQRSGLITVLPGRVLDGPPNLICPPELALALAQRELPAVACLASGPAPDSARTPAPSVEPAFATGGFDDVETAEPAPVSSIAPVALMYTRAEPQLAPDPAEARRAAHRRWLFRAASAISAAAALLLLWQLRGDSSVASAEQPPSPSAAKLAAEPATQPAASSVTLSEPKPGAVLAGLALVEAARSDDSALRSRRVSEGCSDLPRVGEPGDDLSGERRVADAAGARRQVASARRALTQGKLKAAQIAYCAALHSAPPQAQLMRELTTVLLALGDAGGATKWAERALEFAPNTATAVLLGDAQALAGRFPEARDTWSKAWKVEAAATLRQIGAAHLKTATRAWAQRDASKAERFYRRAAVLDPTHAGAALGLAELLFVQGHDREATAWAGRASGLETARVEERLIAWALLAKLGEKTADGALADRAAAALIGLRAQTKPAQAAKYAATPAANSESSR